MAEKNGFWGKAQKIVLVLTMTVGLLGTIGVASSKVVKGYISNEVEVILEEKGVSKEITTIKESMKDMVREQRVQATALEKNNELLEKLILKITN